MENSAIDFLVKKVAKTYGLGDAAETLPSKDEFDKIRAKIAILDKSRSRKKHSFNFKNNINCFLGSGKDAKEAQDQATQTLIKDPSSSAETRIGALILGLMMNIIETTRNQQSWVGGFTEWVNFGFFNSYIFLGIHI